MEGNFPKRLRRVGLAPVACHNKRNALTRPAAIAGYAYLLARVAASLVVPATITTTPSLADREKSARCLPVDRNAPSATCSPLTWHGVRPAMGSIRISNRPLSGPFDRKKICIFAYRAPNRFARFRCHDRHERVVGTRRRDRIDSEASR